MQPAQPEGSQSRPQRPQGPLKRALAQVALAGLAVLSTGCETFVRYADELKDKRSGRTLFVRAPAQLGGTVGVVVGVPLDVVVSPVTYTIYSAAAEDDGTTDPVSYLLFHTFTLWKVGSMLGAPFDTLEFVCWRAWQPEDNLSAQERESLELKEDRRALPRYPVEPIYPPTPAVDVWAGGKLPLGY